MGTEGLLVPGSIFLLSAILRLWACSRLSVSWDWGLQGAALDALPLALLSLAWAMALPWDTVRRALAWALGLSAFVMALFLMVDATLVWQTRAHVSLVLLDNVNLTAIKAFACSASLAFALLGLASAAGLGAFGLAKAYVRPRATVRRSVAMSLAAMLALGALAWLPWVLRDPGAVFSGKAVEEAGREEARGLIRLPELGVLADLSQRMEDRRQWSEPSEAPLDGQARAWAKQQGLGLGAKVLGKPLRLSRVVVITMESMPMRLISSRNPRLPAGLTPNLDRLLAHQPHLEQCFSVGHETDQGQYALFCGRMDFERVNRAYPDCSVPRLFAQKGFNTELVHGCSAFYRSHFRTYPAMLGLAHLYSKEDYSALEHREMNGWGGAMNDSAVFRQSLALLIKGRKQPQFMIINTLDTHPPYERSRQEAPASLEGRELSPLLRSVAQLDLDLGRFLKDLTSAGLDDEGCLVVITADHAPAFSRQYLLESGALAFGLEPVPLIFWGKASKALSRLDQTRLCCQLDLAPTLAGLLGAATPCSFMGADLRAAWPGRQLGQSGRTLFLRHPGSQMQVEMDPRGLPQTLDTPLARWYRWQAGNLRTSLCSGKP